MGGALQTRPFLVPEHELIANRFPLSGSSSCRDAAAQFLVNINPDDLVEGGFGLESERLRPPGVEAAGPTLVDPHDGLVRLAADQGDGLLSGQLSERLDLLADGAENPRHREIDPRADLLA